MWGSILKVAIVIALPLLGLPGLVAVYGLLVIWAAISPRRAMEALILAVLPTTLNPGIWPESESIGAVLRWLVVFVAFARVVVGVAIPFPAPTRWVLGLAIVGLMSAPFVAAAPDVSIMKIVTFFVGACAALIGFWKCRGHNWTPFFIGFLLVVVVTSAPLMFSQIGVFLNKRGFQGITNHPQFFGGLLAPLTAWLLAMIYVGKVRPFWIGLAVLALVQIFMSESRNAALAVALGLAAAAGTRLFSVRPDDFQVTPRALAVSAGSILAGAFLILQFDRVAAFLNAFMSKRLSGGSLDTVFAESRGQLLRLSLENFENNPWLGIGFGMPSIPWQLEVVRVGGIPVSAAVEKGIWYVAVLEELGIIGAALTFGMLIAIALPTFRRGAAPAAALVFTIFASNLGEATMFSAGGLGIFLWALLAQGYNNPIGGMDVVAGK